MELSSRQLLPLFSLLFFLSLLSFPSLSLSYTPPAPLDRVAYDILHGMDPSKDPFLSLRMHERESYLSDIDNSKDIADMVSSLIKFEDKTLVTVKLVGLDDIKVNDLMQYMDALNTLDPLHTLDGKVSEDSILFERKTMLTVKHAPASLYTSLNDALSKQVTPSMSRIPYTVVDNLIKADFQESGSQSHTIYILNLPRQKNDYVYVQYEAGKAPQRGTCVTSSWAGQERYTWIDLRAGPVNYGPLVVGEGFVDQETLPYAYKYENAKSGQLKVDLSAHVYQTHKHLIAPSLTRFPRPWTTLEIHLVMIHDHDVGGHEESELFNWKAIQDQILGMPILNGQNIIFKKSEKSLLSDDVCALIKASSTKTYANERKTVKTSIITTNHYLDSKELHYWLRLYKERLIGQTRAPPELSIPIFIFDISYKNDVLLLDRVHQAVSFPDMVVAIQTQLSPVESDYSCNGNTIRIDPRDATRPVLASLLQSIWGIAPTHQTYNRNLKRAESNYLWSIGLTPFAPFSIHTNLSFAHGDAAARHLLYTHIQDVVGPLAAKLEHFLDFSLEMGDILDEQEYLEFIHRWNFLHFKLYHVKKYLSLNLYNASFAFVRSAEHDTKALTTSLHSVHGRIHSFLKCGEEKIDYVPIGSVTFTSVMGIIAAAILANKLWKKWKKPTSIKKFD